MEEMNKFSFIANPKTGQKGLHKSEILCRQKYIVL